MPIGFALIAIRMWWQSGLLPPHQEFETRSGRRRIRRPSPGRGAPSCSRSILAAFSLAWVPEASVAAWRWPLVGGDLGARSSARRSSSCSAASRVVLFFADAGR